MQYINAQLANQIILAIREVCLFHINFILPTGIIIASTDDTRIGDFHEIGKKVAQREEIIEVDSDQHKGTKRGVNIPLFYKGEVIGVIGITGDPEEAKKYGNLAARIAKLVLREREVNYFNRTNEERKHFIITSLKSTDNLNSTYFLDCLGGINIDINSEKRFLMIRLSSNLLENDRLKIESYVIHFFRNHHINLYTFNYPNEYLALIDDAKFEEINQCLKKSFEQFDSKVTIAIGKKTSFFNASASYQSALTAYRTLKGMEHQYCVFDDLTLEIVLSAVEANIKREFVEKTISSLKEDEIEILMVYYDSEMSLGITSQKLFLHKNTLQYKLNSIHKETGFNPRKFKDATILYLALKLNSDGNGS